jgi:hypothetical protein
MPDADRMEAVKYQIPLTFLLSGGSGPNIDRSRHHGRRATDRPTPTPPARLAEPFVMISASDVAAGNTFILRRSHACALSR